MSLEPKSIAAKGGLMERAERIIMLCLGLLFPVLLIPILWVMLALIAVTAVQIVWQGLTGRGVSAPGVATMQEFRP